MSLPRLGDARHGKLFDNLSGFGRALRRAGVPVDASRMALAADAATRVDLGQREDLRAALACVLTSRAADRALFDELFDAYFRDPDMAHKLLAQMLPDKLAMLRTLLPILAVLPLLGSNSTWLSAWHQWLAVVLGLAMGVLLPAAFRLPGDGPPPAAGEAPSAGPSRSVGQRLADPFFWRKLIASTLALAVGQGLGAVNPKYVYFGVVILLNESLGATLGRVRDRMVGVSLGIFMPWLVFNIFGVSSVSLGLVMGGTAALLPLVGLKAHLRTALISSGVTFAGYQALADWYIPTRWIDYLLGCGLALLVCLLFSPTSALQRFRTLAAEARLQGRGLEGELLQLLPSAREEALWLGQRHEFEALVAGLAPPPP